MFDSAEGNKSKVGGKDNIKRSKHKARCIWRNLNIAIHIFKMLKCDWKKGGQEVAKKPVSGIPLANACKNNYSSFDIIRFAFCFVNSKGTLNG